MIIQTDYDELTAARIPIEHLPTLFGVNARTIRRWLEVDNIETHQYGPSQFGDPHGKAIRWGDVPITQTGSTRWKRR